MFHYLLPLPQNISHIEAFEPEELGEPEVSASPQGGRSPAREKPRHDPGNNDVQDCLQKNLAWVSKIA